MDRYATHVRQVEPPSARLNGTNPKSKNEMPSPNVERLEDGEEQEEGELPRGGLGAAGGGRPDHLAQGHRGDGEEGCDEGYFDPGLQDGLLPLASGRTSVVEVSRVRVLCASPK
jgi:hypothetical protein